MSYLKQLIHLGALLGVLILMGCGCKTVTEGRSLRNSGFISENWYRMTTDDRSYQDCPSVIGDNSTISSSYQDWVLRYSGTKLEIRNISKKINISHGAFDSYAVNGKLFTTIDGVTNGKYWWDATLYNPETDVVEYTRKGQKRHPSMAGTGDRVTDFYGWKEPHLLLVVQASNLRGANDRDYIHGNYKGRISPFFIVDLKTHEINNLNMKTMFPEVVDSVLWYDLRLIGSEVHGVYYQEKDSTINVIKQAPSGNVVVNTIPYDREVFIRFLRLLIEKEKYIGFHIYDGILGDKTYSLSLGWTQTPYFKAFDTPWDSVSVTNTDTEFSFYDAATKNTLTYPPLKNF